MSKLLLSYLFKTNLATFRSAIVDENTAKICRLLDFDRDLLSRDIDNEGNTALLLAVEHASPLIVRLLLDLGAACDQANSISLKTPLGVLASKVYDDYHSYEAQKVLDLVKILLDYGAYVDKPIPYIYKDENSNDYSGKETPLMIAVRKGNSPLVALLLERKADVNYIERQSGIRPIHYAISNGDEKMFDLLDNAGALASTCTINGDNTLLHWFCYRKENDAKTSLLGNLLKRGFDVNAQNLQQRTPLMIAVRNDMTKTCRILLQHNASIDKRDYNGNQAIDLSIAGSECSKILLHATRTEKFKLQLQKDPLEKPRNTIIRRQRIDIARRRTTELSEINNRGSKTDDSLSKSSMEEKESHGSPRPYTYPNKIKLSEEIDSGCEGIWESTSKTKQTELLSKTFPHERALSMDADDIARL